MEEKKKLLVISDHPFSFTGVGTQTKYVIESLLNTGRYKIVCMAGAVKHDKYEPQKTEEWGDDLVIFPVDGYGNHDIVRSIIMQERPDAVWIMTDPRYWVWLWQIEDEIRAHCPLIYYHVWDNFPPPKYNKPFYDSNDYIACISKVTHECVQVVSPDVDCSYIPHAVNTDVFKKYSDIEMDRFIREASFDKGDKFVLFFNNRNIRRKLAGSLLYWYKEFLDRVGPENAMMLMHTQPKDPHGQDLVAIIEELGLTNGEVLFSTKPLPPEGLAKLYNIADCTINIADAEGFGLGTLESLACETPIIVNMTGGLQEQVTDGERWFGIGLEPDSKAIIGSQDIPYIREDRLNGDRVVQAMLDMYNKTKEEREELGRFGREHVMKNYNFETFNNQWIKIVDYVVDKHGSWKDRKNHVSWTCEEL